MLTNDFKVKLYLSHREVSSIYIGLRFKELLNIMFTFYVNITGFYLHCKKGTLKQKKNQGTT